MQQSIDVTERENRDGHANFDYGSPKSAKDYEDKNNDSIEI
jgi:hypothetical protein